MTQLFKPNSWSLTSLAGPDARDFLHRLTTVDARNLSPGEGSPGFFLTAQGKVRAYFTLWCYGADEFALEYSGGHDGQWKASLLSTIDQFTFAEKMTLTDLGQMECVWLFGDSLGMRARETRAVEPEIRVCNHGETDYGRPWVSAWGMPEKLKAWLSDIATQNIDTAELERWRIGAARPRVDAELTFEASPLEIGLYDAIADNKGCYPGQEVVEKIISLGSPARRLVLIEGNGTAPAAGDTVLNEANPPIEVGVLTSATATPNGFQALAVLRKIHAQENMPVAFKSGVRGAVKKVAPYKPA